MFQKIEHLGLPAVSAGLTIAGVGSIITAIVVPKLPMLRTMNGKALTALRVTTGVAGGAGTIAGLAGLGYSLSKKKSSSQHSRSSSNGSGNVSSGVEPQPDPLLEAFVEAVTDGNRDEVERLLNEGDVDINGTVAYEAKQVRPLTVAICEGNVEVVELLLGREGILTSSDQGDDLYTWAQRSGQIGVVGSLLKARVPRTPNPEADNKFVIWVIKSQRRFDLIPLLQDCEFRLDAGFCGEAYQLCEWFYDVEDKEGFRALVEAGAGLEFLHHFTDKRGDELRAWAFAQLGIEEQAGGSFYTSGEDSSDTG